MSSSTSHSVVFTNHQYDSFTSTIDFTCNYEYSFPPEFSSDLTILEVITAGTAQEWTFPTINIGSLPHQELRFVPDSMISSYLTLSRVTTSPLVYKVSYSSDLSIYSINGKKSQFLIELTLVNTYG